MIPLQTAFQQLSYKVSFPIPECQAGVSWIWGFKGGFQLTKPWMFSVASGHEKFLSCTHFSNQVHKKMVQAAKSHTDPAVYCQTFTHCHWPMQLAAKSGAKSSSLLRRWCTLCRCRASLLSMDHQPEAPQPGPQFPDPHSPMLIAVKWVFPFPLDSLSLPKNILDTPKPKINPFLGNLAIKIGVAAALLLLPIPCELLFSTPLDVSLKDCYLGKSTITWINTLHKPSDCISDLCPSQTSPPSFGSSGRSLVFSRFSVSVLCSFAMIELQLNP